MGASSCAPCGKFVSPAAASHVLIFGLAVGLPNLLFVFFLVSASNLLLFVLEQPATQISRLGKDGQMWNLRKNVRKLINSKSLTMTTYYVLLWVVSIETLILCFSLLVGCNFVAGSVLWLFVRFGYVLLETSVVVLLLHGYLAVGHEVIWRTLLTSGLIAVVDVVVEAIVIFGARIQLYFNRSLLDTSSFAEDMVWPKWGFRMACSLLAVVAYAGIMVLPSTRWRDLVPARPAFYTYVQLLGGVHLLSAIGSALLGSHVAPGYCLVAVSMFLRFAGYPALLYLTFLSDFLADDQLDLDVLYYSEMREAGCFDEAHDVMAYR